jgi:hypothetical protein
VGEVAHLFHHIRNGSEPISFSKEFLDSAEFTMKGTSSSDLDSIKVEISLWRENISSGYWDF